MCENHIHINPLLVKNKMIKVNMKFVLAFALVTVVAGQVAVSAMETESDDMVIIEPDQAQNARGSRQFVTHPQPYFGATLVSTAGTGLFRGLPTACQTQNRENGVCRNINECYPERKIFQIEPKDNWIFGLYNTCGHQTARGRQVFGVCCTKNITQIPTAPNVVQVQEKKRTNLSSKKCSPMPTIHKCNFDGRTGGKIVNGKETPKNAYPFMAALMRVSSYSNRPRQFCGGSLIDESHILTAAHCIEGFSASDVKTLRIYLGAHDIKSSSDGRSEHRVVRIIKHKDFDPKTLVNDIAILTLETPARMTNIIQTVCLPNYHVSHLGEKVTVAGWGALAEGGGQPAKLHEVDVTVWSNDECGRKYNNRIPGKIVNTMICAADPSRDSCSGDSGGPLYMKRNGYLVQLGIVSWGIGCARPDSPGVYTRVTKMMDWIRRIQNCY